MRIPLDRQSAVPLYQQIETYLRQGILSGSLAADTRLPASRQLARDLGVNENTPHTWIGKYHRAERQEKEVNAEHLYEELKRLRKENARLKEEREILKKAAAYFAPPLP